MADVFISHATEDKEKVARPLAEALRNYGLDVWYDEFSLVAGDSLRESIDKGILECRFGVVIFSKSFFHKEWPQKELNGLISREIHGNKLIIPIWHDIEYDDIVKYSPTLADRIAIKSNEGLEQMVNKIIKKVKPELLKEQKEVPLQPLVDIIANKDSIILGKTVFFSGHSRNSGKVVHIVVYGLGKFSKGLEIASPLVSGSGQWDYEWKPEPDTKSGEYMIRVFDSLYQVSDELRLRIEKGTVLMVVAGDQVRYIGEKIKLSGISTTSYKVFLSIKRHGLFTKQTKIDQLNVLSQTDDLETFTKVDVYGDNTWSYIWDTSLIASDLKSGYYTIFATEFPRTYSDIDQAAFSSMSIVLEMPFVSCMVSHSSITQGNELSILGTAAGQPQKGIQVWIFGDYNYLIKKAVVHQDASYIFKLTSEETKRFKPGLYFVVIQHPMLNNEFDVYFDEKRKTVMSNFPKKETELFSLDGSSMKKGIDAANALIEALNYPEIDDTYTKLQFLIEKQN